MFGHAHDEKMWRSLNKEQRAWVRRLLEADQLAVDARESVGCAFAFDLGQQMRQPGFWHRLFNGS